MWQKFKEQIPGVIVTVVVLGAFSAWMIDRAEDRQEAQIAPLREQNEALRALSDENQRQIEATAQMLRTAVGNHEGELFKTDQEIAKMNGDRINVLAKAIADKVVPVIPGPKSVEELAKMEDEQAEQISSRIVEKMRPELAQNADTAKAAVAEQERERDRDRDRIQGLNNRLQAAQAAADDALNLSHEIAATYVGSLDNHGVLARVLALPIDLANDAAGGSLITSRDKDKVKQKLDEQMQELQKRLYEIQNQGNTAAN